MKGTPGVLHGTRTLLLQDRDGQIAPTHSISAGLGKKKKNLKKGVSVKSPTHVHIEYFFVFLYYS